MSRTQRYYAKAKENKEDPEDYLMDHSAITYLMGPNGKFVAHFSHGTWTEPLAKELKKIWGSKISKGIIISAPGSGSGKTLFTLSLLRHLKNRKIRVNSAKIGPDYIDIAFHSFAITNQA